MSDWVSTYSAAGAANAGLDLEMPTAQWLNREKLLPEVKRGAVSQAVIDDKVRRMLRLAACFGWLDHEQQDPSIPLDDPTTAAVALEVARAGAVLLKNDGLLPFDEREVKTVAVLGSHAHPAVICGGGSAYTPPNHAVSVLDGVRALLGSSATVLHAVGFDPGREWRCFGASEFVTDDGQPGLAGQYFANRERSGEPVVTRVDPRMDFNWYGRSPAPGLGKLDVSVRWTGRLVVPTSGSHTLYVACPNGEFRLAIDGNTVLDFLEGKPHESTEQIVVECAAGVAKSITLDYVKTEWSSIHVGWEPTADIERDRRDALDTARNADAVLLCVGFTSKTESEGFDRTFELPEGVDAWVRDVAAANPRTAVVLFAGGNVDMNGFIDAIPALLHVWYPGQEGGTAIAELLFGRVTPSGRLPATFEKRLEDRSASGCYHDSDGDRHVALSDGIFFGYRHFDQTGIEPRFPFGFGLSYTTFEYSNLGVSSDTMTETGRLRVSFDVRNSGSRRGAETALLFVRDVASHLPRPVKEFKGFTKVLLEPGASRRVDIEIGRDELVYFDPELHDWVYEPGEFEILVGASAADVRLRTTVRAV
jgi:beta-glucosidase